MVVPATAVEVRSLDLVTRSAAATADVGAALVHGLRRGDIVLLTGGIGSGKTVLAKGVARGLGIEETVVSPSFLLHGIYRGRLTLNHFDFYRLNDPAEAAELGIEEAAESGVTLIEWGDRFPGLIEPPFLEIHFELGDGPDDRDLTFRFAGDEWWHRLPRLFAA
jgi:tRNA threonylcarbamoyladenosine biosynthesis protein TsaE